MLNEEWKKKVNSWKELLFHLKKSQLLLLLFAGILLLLASFPKKNQTEETIDTAETENMSENHWEDYESYMERRVEKVLETVEGVGKTEVVLTFRTNGEKVVEKDTDSDQQTVTENDAAGGNRVTNNNTTQKKSIYEQQKDGTQSPYVSKELTPEIEGVLVVAEGGDNPVVVKNITEAVQALFGVEAHKIKIMKRTDT